MKLRFFRLFGAIAAGLLTLSVINVAVTTLIYNVFPDTKLAQIESKFKKKQWGNYYCETIRGQVERECHSGIFSERGKYMDDHGLIMLTPWTYKSEEGHTIAIYWKNILP